MNRCLLVMRYVDPIYALGDDEYLYLYYLCHAYDDDVHVHLVFVDYLELPPRLILKGKLSLRYASLQIHHHA